MNMARVTSRTVARDDFRNSEDVHLILLLKIILQKARPRIPVAPGEETQVTVTPRHIGNMSEPFWPKDFDYLGQKPKHGVSRRLTEGGRAITGTLTCFTVWRLCQGLFIEVARFFPI